VSHSERHESRDESNMATLSCPVCRATNDAGLACRRCKADLSLLRAVEDHRAAVMAAARRELAQGCFDGALELARQAATLRRGADLDRLEVVLCLLRRDFSAAWSNYLGQSLTPAGDV
jgi:hypothetical protein